ncbi:MAG TPA: DNA-binding domain-containing protein, partial [Thermoanaerobaculia bacterium]|nr:DNA-binding domain-containing protein [Thermoanaerobaculia bacterium]
MQQWMQDAITGAESPRADDVALRILPSRTLTPVERIEIYRGMYPMRMAEALGADYPAIVHFLGHHQFEHLVDDYTKLYPSRSYTFNRFGDHFPEFLAKHTNVPRAFVELANLELAITKVFDDEEVPLLTEIAGLDLDSTLPTIPALRAMKFTYDVDALYDAFHAQTAAKPKRAKTHLVIFRRDYSVRRRRIEERAYTFLRALSEGKTLGDAIALVMPAQEELFAWFREWNAAGWL